MPPTLSRESSLDAIFWALGVLHATEADALRDASNIERGIALVAALCGMTSLAKNYNNYDFNPARCVEAFVKNAVDPLGQYRTVRFVVGSVVMDNQFNGDIPLLADMLPDLDNLVQEFTHNLYGSGIDDQVELVGKQIYELLLKPSMYIAPQTLGVVDIGDSCGPWRTRFFPGPSQIR